MLCSCIFPACFPRMSKISCRLCFHRHQPEFSSAVVLEFDAVRNFQAVSFSDSADPARPGPSYIHMFRHLNRHAEPVIPLPIIKYTIRKESSPRSLIRNASFSIGVSMYASRISSENFQFFLFCQIIFLRIHLPTSVYVLPGSEHPGRRSYVPFSITLKCLVYNDFPFKKMPHAKSAKSTTTTVLYGIFQFRKFLPVYSNLQCTPV